MASNTRSSHHARFVPAGSGMVGCWPSSCVGSKRAPGALLDRPRSGPEGAALAAGAPPTHWMRCPPHENCCASAGVAPSRPRMSSPRTRRVRTVAPLRSRWRKNRGIAPWCGEISGQRCARPAQRQPSRSSPLPVPPGGPQHPPNLLRPVARLPHAVIGAAAQQQQRQKQLRQQRGGRHIVRTGVAREVTHRRQPRLERGIPRGAQTGVVADIEVFESSQIS